MLVVDVVSIFSVVVVVVVGSITSSASTAASASAATDSSGGGGGGDGVVVIIIVGGGGGIVVVVVVVVIIAAIIGMSGRFFINSKLFGKTSPRFNMISFIGCNLGGRGCSLILSTGKGYGLTGPVPKRSTSCVEYMKAGCE